MTPVFMSSAVSDSGFGKAVGSNAEHLRLAVKQDQSIVPAIGFGLGNKLPLIQNHAVFRHCLYSRPQ